MLMQAEGSLETGVWPRGPKSKRSRVVMGAKPRQGDRLNLVYFGPIMYILHINHFLNGKKWGEKGIIQSLFLAICLLFLRISFKIYTTNQEETIHVLAQKGICYGRRKNKRETRLG